MLRNAYGAVLWAMERKMRAVNEVISSGVRQLRKEIEHEFGLKSRLASSVLGPLLWWTSNREEKRLDRGVTYEPPTFVERRNWMQA